MSRRPTAPTSSRRGTWSPEYMGDHDAPSTLLGVALLGYPDQLVEVEAIAALR